jgi:hypothetical protein
MLKMNKNALFTILVILSVNCIKISDVIAFENLLTHPALTKCAVDRSVLGPHYGYLENQLGLGDGLATQFELAEQFQNNIGMRAAQQPLFNWNKTNIPIKQWLMEGSKLEDVPGIRARHHFHDPIRNTGLNNPGLVAELLNLSQLWYPTYWSFDAKGGSAFKRAIGCADDWGIDWESEPGNLWPPYQFPIFQAGYFRVFLALKRQFFCAFFVKQLRIGLENQKATGNVRKLRREFAFAGIEMCFEPQKYRRVHLRDP